jgi:deoxyribose-phosphate aldolase
MSNLLLPLNRYFDHAILKSDATEAQVRDACAEAREGHFFGLAVNPCWTELIVSELKDSDVTVVGVAGFPLGATTTRSKIAEALEAALLGAGEVDMVANIGRIVAGDLQFAEAEIKELRRELPDEIALKVIIEAPTLSVESIRQATKAAINAGAQFVKTATGFFGATTSESLATVVEANNNQIKVKASGGVRTLAMAEEFIKLGADRLGSSASVAIMNEFNKRLKLAERS